MICGVSSQKEVTMRNNFKIKILLIAALLIIVAIFCISLNFQVAVSGKSYDQGIQDGNDFFA